MADVAAEFRVTHLPEVARTAQGTPLVSSIFALARDHARVQAHSPAPLLCYVNADILLTPDVVQAARRVQAQTQEFLIIGRRWNLDVTEPLDFSPGWVERLHERTHREGALHVPAGSDYFIFPRPLFADMPDFAIGRAGWDNWTIYHARRQGWPTIDATPDVFIVHQNHDYSHLPGGQPHYNHEESHRNIALARGPENNYTGYILLDTNCELRNGKIVIRRLAGRSICLTQLGDALRPLAGLDRRLSGLERLGNDFADALLLLRNRRERRHAQRTRCSPRRECQSLPHEYPLAVVHRTKPRRIRRDATRPCQCP